MDENISSKKSSMVRFMPALGLVLGSVVGDIIGVVFEQNIAAFAAIGAGLGLVAGTIIYMNKVKNLSGDESNDLNTSETNIIVASEQDSKTDQSESKTDEIANADKSAINEILVTAETDKPSESANVNTATDAGELIETGEITEQADTSESIEIPVINDSNKTLVT